MSTLFNDGLNLVHSFLTTSEWNSAARVSRHWFHVASSSNPSFIDRRMSQLDIPIHASRTFLIGPLEMQPKKPSLLSRVGNLFVRDRDRNTSTNSTLLTSSSTSSTSSTWSLRHCITSMIVNGQLDSLPRIVQLLTNLNSLTLHTCTEKSKTSKERKDRLRKQSIFAAAIKSKSLIFPYSLTSFAMTTGWSDDPPTLPQLVLDMFAFSFNMCSLTSINIGLLDIDTLDLTPFSNNLSIVNSLKTLFLKFADAVFTNANSQQVVTCMTHISRLQHLTDLTLMSLPIDSVAIESMLPMPALIELHADYMILTSSNMKFLSVRLPSIEILRGYPQLSIHEFDVYTLFRNLKEIVLGPHFDPHNSDSIRTERHIISTLCNSSSIISHHNPSSSSSLTSVMFQRWSNYPTVEDFQLLCSTFPSLHKLVFHSVRDILGPMSVLDEKCAHRWTKLVFHRCDAAILMSDSASNALSSLTFLQLSLSLPYSSNLEKVIGLFNRHNFMSRLRVLMIDHWEDYVEWNVDERTNVCVIKGKKGKLDRPTPKPKVENSNVTPTSIVSTISSSSSTTPPAPHLVGIELNPGPMNLLFNSGLSLIYSFLTTSEWNQCARTSLHWYHVIASGLHLRTASGESPLIVAITNTNLIASLLKRENTLFNVTQRIWKTVTFSTSSKKQQQQQHQQQSPIRPSWSLRHLISSINLTSSLDALPRLIDFLPHLHSLQIQLPNPTWLNPVFSDVFVSAVSHRSFTFPSSLTSLTIESHSEASPLPHLVLDMFAFAFTSSSHLTELKLGFVDLDSADTSFIPLCENLSLRQSLNKLFIHFHSAANTSESQLPNIQVAIMLRQISFLKNLTHLGLSRLPINIDTSAIETMLPMPALIELEASRMELTPDNLKLLATRVPAITILRGSSNVPIDQLDVYALFPHLCEISLGRTFLDTLSPVYLDNHASALCSLTLAQLPLSHLKFTQSTFSHIESWNLMTATFPLLSEISFYALLQFDPLLPLLEASQSADSAAASRWTKLSVEYCQITRSTLHLLRASPFSFPSLKCLIILHSFSNLSVDTINKYVDSPDFLPQLEQLHVRHKNEFTYAPGWGEGTVTRFEIKYDEKKKINRCTLNEKVTKLKREPQKLLHHLVSST